jgi:hypothetical protein
MNQAHTRNQDHIHRSPWDLDEVQPSLLRHNQGHNVIGTAGMTVTDIIDVDDSIGT